MSINQARMRLENYPGRVDPKDSSIWIFPDIVYMSSAGKQKTEKRHRVCIQMCRGTAEQAVLSEAKGTCVPIEILPEYFDQNPPFPVYCRRYQITIARNQSFSKATLITAGKNLDRTNATSVFHQALIDAFAVYYRFALSNRIIVADSPHLHDKAVNALNEKLRSLGSYVPPMLASNEDPQTWFAKHREGGIYMQPKYNGVRALAVLEGAELKVWTRSAQLYPYCSFTDQLLALMLQYPDLVFDGEAYAHGHYLQEISGSMRNQGKGGKVPIRVDYYIFDMFDPSNPAMKFADRAAFLEKLGATNDKTAIKFTPTIRAETYPEIDAYFKEMTAAGYEGLILRDGSAAYEPSYNKYRSSGLCKYKNSYSSEFLLIGWREGEGKAAQQVAAFEMEITQVSVDNLNGQVLSKALTVGSRFSCNVKATDETKKEWFTAFKNGGFEKDYRGRYCTVEFYDVSTKGVPQQAYWIDFRDDIEDVDRVAVDLE